MNQLYNFNCNTILKNDSVVKKTIPYNSNYNAFLVQELTELCYSLVNTGCLTPPVKFFTQHNRDNVIFRAYGNWKDDT